MIIDCLEDDTSSNKLFFDHILRPNHSCSPEMTADIMRWVMIASLSIGAMFFLSGAWPVVGFLGLDVLLLYLGFKVYETSAKRYEHLRLDQHRLQIETGNAKGMRSTIEIEPAFLQIVLSNDVAQRLTVGSHGRHVEIGRWISPGEKQDVAVKLQRALHHRKTALTGVEQITS